MLVRLASFLVCSTLLASAAPVPGADDTDPSRAMYLRYCGACHGPSGQGDGIAGSLMRPKPPDLTRLAKERGGKFPLSA